MLLRWVLRLLHRVVLRHRMTVTPLVSRNKLLWLLVATRSTIHLVIDRMELIWTNLSASSRSILITMLLIFLTTSWSLAMHGIVMLIIISASSAISNTLIERHFIETIVIKCLHVRHFIAVWHLLHVIVVSRVHSSTHHFVWLCEVLNPLSALVLYCSRHLRNFIVILYNNCVASIVAFSFDLSQS